MKGHSLSVGDRATIANMTPEYGATAGMFFIDDQTIEYLRLTGREDEQVALVEKFAKETGLWADSLKEVEYERVLTFDLSSVGVTWQVHRIPTPCRCPNWAAVALPRSGNRKRA